MSQELDVALVVVLFHELYMSNLQMKCHSPWEGEGAETQLGDLPRLSNEQILGFTSTQIFLTTNAHLPAILPPPRLSFFLPCKDTKQCI